MTASDFCRPGASRHALILVFAALLVASTPLVGPRLALAQGASAPRNVAARKSGDEPLYTLNFRDADIAQIADAVSMATHKTFIVDPRVRAQVTMISSTPVDAATFYETFQSILQVHQFIAVPGAGGTMKIIPDANQRFYPGSHDLQDHVSSSSDEVVTQVIPVKNVSAVQLVTVLRPLVPTTGQINAYSPTNMVIISDHASNVSRVMKIIERLDQVGDADVEVMPMQNASAIEIVRSLTSLYQGGQAQQDPGIQPLKLVADERSNSILISGEPAARMRAKALISSLDTPQQGGGDTQVRYLHYADSDKLAPKLKEQLTGIAAAAAGSGGAGGGTTPAAQDSKNAQIWSDPTNNALVITAPPKVRRQINDIIDQLDIRRAEVLVEAIIVDVNMTKSAELGVNWATWQENNGQVIPGATFLTPVGGATLVDLANAISSSGTNINSALETGATLAVGRVAQNGLSFAAMLRALRSDTDSNIVATPSAMTMDHQEATIKVVEEVPFVTGQYTSGSTVTNGQVSPFQTIQQIEVGTILKITPQINERDEVVLKIDIESSSVIATPSGASGITTSKRSVTTNVLIENGGIIVLGGLISNEYDRSKSQVPFLGSIPLLGELFKDHSASQTKSNLMIFLRPQILSNGTQTAIETNSKYNFIREQQRQVSASDRGSLPLLPGVKPPALPAVPPPPPPGSTPEAPITQEQRDRAAREAQRETDAEARRNDAGSAAPAAGAPSSAPSAAPSAPK
ncbi:MAG TPA: type II secretion system secretin GspD [Steroidobacteraceae bacterium]|nr:type II secretion system secretin GspD [Steroidobacteraceae bacterium]